MLDCETLLVVAAHADDEVLGCGGTMAKAAQRGTNVKVAFFADGISSRSASGIDEEEMVARRAAAQNACEILGVSSPFFGAFPDNQMDTVPLLSIVKVVESLVDQYRPSVILTHHIGDTNIDHRRVHDAIVAACRPQKGHPVRTVLGFEVASSTEWQFPGSAPHFAPNWFEDISHQLSLKLKALAAYAYELREPPHPRSCEAIGYLAKWRGATIGTDAAEAFVLGRHIQ